MQPYIINRWMCWTGRSVKSFLTVRNWRPGDSYTPAGKSGAEKIKTLFQDNRVPLWERRHWPVIVRGDSIVWVRQFGVAGEFAAGPDSTRVLAIRETTNASQSRESNRTLTASIETGGSFGRTISLEQERRPCEPGAEVL